MRKGLFCSRGGGDDGGSEVWNKPALDDSVHSSATYSTLNSSSGTHVCICMSLFDAVPKYLGM